MRLPIASRGLVWGGAAGFLLALSPLRADPNPINFTDPACGFHNGSLRGQNEWAISGPSAAGGDFVFASGTGVDLPPGTSGSVFAYACLASKENPGARDTLAPGEARTIAVNLVLTEGDEKPERPGGIVGMGWAHYVPVSGNNMPFIAELSRAPQGGGYQLGLRNASKGQVSGPATLAIPAAALGFNSAAGRSTSDPLQFSFTLTQADGERKDWNSLVILTNLKTQKSFLLKNEVSGASTIYSAQNMLRTIVNERTSASPDGLRSAVLTALDPILAVDPLTQ